MILLAISLILGLAAWPCLSERHNPLLPGFNPDPAPVRVDDWYFLATSSFEYFPGIPIYRSLDLSNWELYSHALSTSDQLLLYGVPSSAGAWAPTLSYSNGTFYLTSMTRWTYDPIAKTWPRISWVSSRDLKTWSTPIWAEPWGIDPELFHDPQSGRSFLNLMSPNNNQDRLWGISQCEVSLQTGNCIGAYRSIWNGTMPHTAAARPEGPKMSFRNGYYYLLIAEGGTDLLYRASIARSVSPLGPWTPAPNNPILFNGRREFVNPELGNLTVQSTGHGTLINTPENNTYIIYLARRNVNGSSPLGRETFISSVEWKDDWPFVNQGRPILLSEPVSGLTSQEAAPQIYNENFIGERLAQKWYTLRTPYADIYSLGGQSQGKCSHGGGLAFAPNVFDLSDRDVPAAILSKQTSLNMTFSASTFPLPELSPGQALGISAYLSELAHHDVAYGLCRNKVGSCIYTSLIRNGTEIYQEVNLDTTDGMAVEFFIRAEPLSYSLGFKVVGEYSTVTWLTSFPSSWMAFAPPGWFVFEGAMFALFATGKGKPWTASGPVLGFCSATDTFFAENIPDYDSWE